MLSIYRALSCAGMTESGNEAENVFHLSFCSKKHLLLKMISHKKCSVHDKREKRRV